MPVKSQDNEVISFCVGLPWPDEPGAIKVYAHGSQVKSGTMNQAKKFRDYVDQQTGEINNIYILTKVEG